MKLPTAAKLLLGSSKASPIQKLKFKELCSAMLKNHFAEGARKISKIYLSLLTQQLKSKICGKQQS